jgi:undecaprenyl-diphosphatase
LRRPSLPELRGQRFLLWIGMTFFAVNVLACFSTKPQANWPAPSYFTLTILTAWFLSTKLKDIATWKPWRGLVYVTILMALILMPLSHSIESIYPLIHRLRPNWPVNKFDFTYKLKGNAELGTAVSSALVDLPPDAMVMAADYQTASLLAFYVKGHPRTYCVGSYYRNPQERKRLTQFDIWPETHLDRPELLGRDAVYVGMGGELLPTADVYDAFARVDRLPDVTVMRAGVFPCGAVEVSKGCGGLKAWPIISDFTMHRRVIIFAVVFLAVLAGALFLDVPVSTRIHQAGPVTRDHWPMAVLWWMGRFWTTVAVAILLSLWHPWKWRAGGLLCLAGALAGLFEMVIKWLVGRTRPFKGVEPFHLEPFRDGLRGFFGMENQSFPSGHACLSFAMAAMLGILLPRWKPLFFALASLVALERVLEGAHYPADVVGGAGIGIASAYLCLWAAQKIFGVSSETRKTTNA